jgi:hypothetical protein
MAIRPFGAAGGRASVALSIGLLVAACGPGAPSGSRQPDAATAGSTAPGSAVASAPTATPSSTQPSPATTAESSIPLPPSAWLAVEGGDPVVGALGGFTWMDSGSASPWLPGTPLHVGTGERLTMALADGVGIAGWAVRRSSPAALGVDPIGMADGAGEPLTFDAPAAGMWSVNVELRFAGDLGSAAYFWLITTD